MRKLTEEELKNMRGGFSVWLGIGIGAFVVFLTGVLDGVVHPKSCEGGSK